MPCGDAFKGPIGEINWWDSELPEGGRVMNGLEPGGLLDSGLFRCAHTESRKIR